MEKDLKDVLLKDLCARLPYGVIVETSKGRGHICDINLTIFGDEVGVNINPTSRDKFNVEKCKPYLFPLSSMTEEQREELKDMNWSFDDSVINNIVEYLGNHRQFVTHFDCFALIDWCNKNYIDYRGLIPMGLATDCTNLNIY